MKTMKRLIRTTLLLAAFGSGGALSAQIDSQDSIPVLSAADLKLHYYAVQNVSTQELMHLVSNTVGRSFYVEERGGRAADPISNLQQLGDSIVVYDLEPDVMRILQACEALDRPGTSGDVATPLEVLEYSPRYVSLETVADALKPFQRTIDPDGNTRTGARNITEIRDRNVLIIRETPERMVKLREAIATVDRPERQVLVTCRLLRTVPASNEEGLPGPLVENLRRLVPEYRFDSAGFAMLRTGVSPRQEVKLRLGEDFVLEFRPVAFDPKTQALTVERCRFERSLRGRGEDGSEVTETIFDTRAILRGGEYTVLGASGAELPLFVVIELKPLDSVD